jgi:hypothetical protein
MNRSWYIDRRNYRASTGAFRCPVKVIKADRANKKIICYFEILFNHKEDVELVFDKGIVDYLSEDYLEGDANIFKYLTNCTVPIENGKRIKSLEKLLNKEILRKM